jgi:TRAP-type mannitol/chloroaromatic compound transport system permease small subunit
MTKNTNGAGAGAAGPPGPAAHPLLTVAAAFEALSRWVGWTVAWLSAFMVIVTFLVVVLRYAFDLGWIALQESVTYMHAALFMLAAAFTLQQDGHVRVDILYQKLSRRGRALVDLLGTLLLLLPVAGFIAWTGWGYVMDAWAIQEGSRETGGIPGVYLLKTLILLLPALLTLQGLALVVRNGLFLAGVEAALPRPTKGTRDG